jgi:drug/metabolite transporter (DMT)-like permease
MGVIYALLSGLCLAAIAVAFRLGQDKSVRPIVVSMSLGLVGAVAFGVQCRGECFRAPARVWVAAGLAGLTQYLVARLIRAAMGRGPVATFWCACNLGFLVVVGYSSAFLGERLRAMQLGAVGAGVACVVVASFTVDPSSGTSARQGGRWTYGVILALLLVLNGGMGTAIKDLSAHPLGDGRSLLDDYRALFFVAAYGILGLLALADVVIGGGLRAPWRRVIPVGLLAAVSSYLGMFFLSLAAPYPAAVVFTISSSTAILAAAVLSVVLLGERITPAWCATLALSILTLVLAGIR